jgi:magnesium transporter
MYNTVLQLIDQRNLKAIKVIFENMNEADIADLLQQIHDETDVDQKDLPLLFRLLPKDVAADVFAYMDSDMQEMLINSFTDRELQQVIDDLFIDDTVDIIEEMPANVVSRILKNADMETRKQINQILKYPKDSAGSIMTTEYVYLKENTSAWNGKGNGLYSLCNRKPKADRCSFCIGYTHI